MGLLKEKWFVSWDADPAQRMMRSKKTRDEQIADADLTWSANKGTWTYVTPDNLLLKSKYNPQRFLHTFPGGVAAYLRLMRDNFGARFMVMLTSVYFGVKGFIWRFAATNGQLFYFRYLGINSSDYAAYRVAAMAPWSMKAFIGAIADSMPFLGFHKRSYIAAVSTFGVIGAVGLAAFDLDASKVKIATLFFLFLNLQMAVVDLLTEGKYAELMSHRPKTGGAVVSWVWSVYLTANLLATIIIGLMVEYGYTREMYWAVVPFSMQVLIPVVLGYFPEVRLPPHKHGFNWKLVKTNKNYFLLALLMAVGSVIMTISNLELNDDWKSLLVVAIVLSTVLCTASLYLLPKVLGKSIVYLFLSSALYIDISPALNYFYLADDSCVPGGPHFDSTYYNIYVGIMESLAGILGVTLFHAVMNNWHFRPTFWVTVVLRCAAGMFDLIMVKRWNKDVHIPDKVMFMMGATIIYNVAYMMEFMPSVVLISKLCPKNVEATVYALLAGFSNFGQAIAGTIGLAMLESFKVDLSPSSSSNSTDTGGSNDDGGATCEYSALPTLIIIFNMALPLLSIPLTFFLIPDMRLTDKSPDFIDPTGGETHAMEERERRGSGDGYDDDNKPLLEQQSSGGKTGSRGSLYSAHELTDISAVLMEDNTEYSSSGSASA